jgi:prepilin-type N-terminal cleavage/methylation domain-containing protein
MDRQAGFTLIEIVFVIGVLGVLATLGVRQFDFAGDGLADRIRARDAVIAELQRARAVALHQLPPNQSAVVVADLKTAADPIAADTESVSFSYEQSTATDKPATDQDIEIGENDSDSLYVCVYAGTRRISQGQCELR